MQFDFLKITTVNQIIDIVLALMIVAAIIYIAIKVKVTKVTLIFLSVLFVLFVTTGLLQLNLSYYLIAGLLLTVIFVVCLLHSGAFRTWFSKFGDNKVTKKYAGAGKIIDHEKLYQEVYECVVACSHQKIGALITFEKHDSLNNLTKNGTIINAPVTHELLMTIFYPGTRLHDGAVIIRGNMIYAASVYYTPTTTALSGKYGSRHRAAIGISQISDSVTIVVSEETGRISIAQNGEIEPITPDNFIDRLTELMNQGE